MALELHQLVADLAGAFKAVDETGPQGASKSRTYQPGIGPLTEADSVKRALEWLRQAFPSRYGLASPAPYPDSRQLCDLVIPSEWAIEVKLARPFGDNGIEAEHWSENILHPYPGNISAIGDCVKLVHSGFHERKGIIVYGFEHNPPRIELEVAVKAFEVVAAQVVGVRLGTRVQSEFTDLIHPYHQQGKVYGWEVLGFGG